MGPVRSPISPIADDKFAKITDDLDKIGFKQMCLEK